MAENNDIVPLTQESGAVGHPALLGTIGQPEITCCQGPSVNLDSSGPSVNRDLVQKRKDRCVQISIIYICTWKTPQTIYPNRDHRST